MNKISSSQEEFLCICCVYIPLHERLVLEVDFYTMHGTRSIKIVWRVVRVWPDGTRTCHWVWRTSVKMQLDGRSEGVNVGSRSTGNILW